MAPRIHSEFETCVCTSGGETFRKVSPPRPIFQVHSRDSRWPACDFCKERIPRLRQTDIYVCATVRCSGATHHRRRPFRPVDNHPAL